MSKRFDLCPVSQLIVLGRIGRPANRLTSSPKLPSCQRPILLVVQRATQVSYKIQIEPRGRYKLIDDPVIILSGVLALDFATALAPRDGRWTGPA